MKIYKFEITIKEQYNDEFWESLKGKCGVEDIDAWLKRIFGENGFSIDEDLWIKFKSLRWTEE